MKKILTKPSREMLEVALQEGFQFAIKQVPNVTLFDDRGEFESAKLELLKKHGTDLSGEIAQVDLYGTMTEKWLPNFVVTHEEVTRVMKHINPRLTLTEYLNQTDPARHPVVLLQEGEFNIRPPYGVAGQRRAIIYIDGIRNEYVVKEGSSHVYTVDADGNPKSASVFYLPESYRLQYKQAPTVLDIQLASDYAKKAADETGYEPESPAYKSYYEDMYNYKLAEKPKEVPQAPKVYTEDQVVQLLATERRRAVRLAQEYRDKHRQDFKEYGSVIFERLADECNFIANTIGGVTGLTPIEETIEDRIRKELSK